MFYLYGKPQHKLIPVQTGTVKNQWIRLQSGYKIVDPLVFRQRFPEPVVGCYRHCPLVIPACEAMVTDANFFVSRAYHRVDELQLPV